MAKVSAADSPVTKQRQMVLMGMLVASCAGNMLAETTDPRPTETDSEVGTIEGVVIYEADRKRPWRYRRYYVSDRKKGHLAEAVISLSEVPQTARAANAKPRTWTIDQKDYRFIPETLAVRSGDQIDFTNSDAVLHDVTTQQRERLASEVIKRDSFSLRHRQRLSQTFRDAGGVERPITLSCRFHSAMRGWIYVFDHPFFQVTEKEGTFRLRDVPVGKHRLVMVHPAGNLRWDQVVEVKGGQTQRIEIHVSPDNLLTTDN